MKSWDSLLTPAEREAMKNYKQKEAARKPLPSVHILAELGCLYGWQAIRDVLENNVDSSLMMSLLREGRRIRRRRLAEQYHNVYFLDGEWYYGKDSEGTIDCDHGSDLGFDRMIRERLPHIRKILRKYGIR